MQKVCNSEDGGLNDALKLARRVEYDGVVASAALELSGSWATTLHGDDGERVSVQSPYRWWSMRFGTRLADRPSADGAFR